MASETVVLLSDCVLGVEQFPHPKDPNKVVGRAFVVQDPDNKVTYRIPMDVEASTRVGQKLMGIGGVEVANEVDAKAEILRAAERNGKG